MYDRSTLDITLPTFDSLPSGAIINYMVKVIPSENTIESENYNSLSLIESSITKLYKKTQTDFSKKENMQLLDLHSDKVYHVLISCQVVANNYKEIFGFKYIDNATGGIEEESDDKTVLIVLISVISFVVVVAVVVVIICLYVRRGNLMRTKQLNELTKQINSVSAGEMPEFDN